ncbi:ABC transporter ATP-binding protein [Egicoccus halophilus]|uniref:Spermidine/putrescine import ATP-binding protein PotA n=1 Tax=Egicoccus halophilus TaxID=1670830 RepID=A0A8J3ACU8_9ACTN|nr:ABC transporter ATP-binding protein [Egicoccus halophilus]GGI04064.1 spermidine/putrescine import ATP-binding protein PotA [Egicoccus halophilus]
MSDVSLETGRPPVDATASATGVAVALHGVTKRFPGPKGAEAVTAVDAIDLDIADGEFFSLLGPSGCGKTTTLRMIAGFEYPTAGSIRIFGDEVGLLPPNRRPVNTVFQSYALFPHLSVAQNIAFGLEMQKVDKREVRQRVAEVIELVQLQGRESRRPKQLSGGQQQRVALARALVNHPKVLLLDEPLGALDLKLRQAMQLELKQLQERVGITFVYVTHDQEEALTMSDRIAVMDGGRLLQVGAPTEIYDRPRTRFVADFIGDTNLMPATVVDTDTVRLVDGTPVRVASGRPEGATCTLAIRPEQIGLRSPEHDRDPALDAVHGRVQRVTFLGNATSYEVVADGDADLHVRVRQGNAPGIEHFAVGDRVRVRWLPASATVLED